MNHSSFKQAVANYATSREPFFFLVDFLGEKPFACSLKEAEKEGIFYDIKGHTNKTNKKLPKSPLALKYTPVDKSIFTKAFQDTIRHIEQGDSYLLNLTFPSQIKSNFSLSEIFQAARAPYKLYKDNEFVVFSPERFIKIKDGYIFSNPMKGTIDASIENAEQVLLNNDKELWEHNTIVDLIRNDLALVATDITVEKFRYLDRIKTNRHEILQTSSEISGKLPSDWREQLGNILLKILPAGSVSGAPKKRTVEIINQLEIVPRNFYTGVFGIFDGDQLDSAVAIRFVEKKDDKLYYKSGGGVTALSNLHEEYKELIDKIYVPTI